MCTIMLRDLQPAGTGNRARETFYGERQPWQADRSVRT